MPLQEKSLSPLRLAVVGVFATRLRYGDALLKTPDYEVVAIVDPDIRAARAWARQLRCKPAFHLQLSELLPALADVDAVLLSTSLQSRKRDIEALMGQGVATLAEAPFAYSAAEATLLADAANQHNTLLVPVFPRRFEACFVAAHSYLQSGALGGLRQARCEWSLPYAEGVPLENGVDDLEEDTLVQSLLCQSVDCGRFWFGEALSVSADIAAFRTENRVSVKPIRHEGSVANLIVAHEQTTVSYALSRSRATLPGERYTFTGSQGQLELIAQSGVQHPAFAAPSLVLHNNGRSERLPMAELDVLEGRMVRLLGRFAEGVRSHTAIEPTASDANAALEIVHAAYRSTIENAKVTLPLRHSASFEAFFRRFETTRRLTED